MPNVPTSVRVILSAAVLGLTACSHVPNFVKPYRPDVQQGNWLTQDQIDLLRPGMTREQVRFALGSPTLTSIFRDDRWYYPYLFTPGHGKTEERKFVVYFVDGKLDHWEGDQQPTLQPFQTQGAKRDSLGAQPAAVKPAAQPASPPPAPAPAATSSQPAASPLPAEPPVPTAPPLPAQDEAGSHAAPAWGVPALGAPEAPDPTKE